jgi:hypothetical protein
MDERGRRIGVNEALFRAVNEQIETLNQRLAGVGDMDIVCECGTATCVERVSIPPAEYERVRKDAHRFVVVAGHVAPDYEVVLEDHGGFQVIEKVRAAPERIAEETDPRA